METDSRLWAECAPEHMALLAAGSLQTGWVNIANDKLKACFIATLQDWWDLYIDVIQYRLFVMYPLSRMIHHKSF